MNNFIEIIMSFIATFSFSILFNIPKKELVYCGLSGSACWFIYKMTLTIGGEANTVLASFLATIAISIISRFFSYNRRVPLTIYMIAGIIPIVPGAGIYYTMQSVVNNENIEALSRGVETLKIAGVIAVGTIFILSLPIKFFQIKLPLISRYKH